VKPVVAQELLEPRSGCRYLKKNKRTGFEMEKKGSFREPKAFKSMFVPTGKRVFGVFTSMTLSRLFNFDEIVYPTPPTSYL
jgi:hypothetical protein